MCQGHLLKHSESAEDCLATVGDLIKSRIPTPEDRTTVWQHLRRVGLEYWSPFLEFRGFHWKDDLAGINKDDLADFCVELRHEPSEVDRLKRLLDDEVSVLHNAASETCF